ncbi:PilX N-terminal domain-containing pilus assembly protein [Pseudoduganella sp. UC29_106]|uniref:pilus assembly PilX family protein n=1 Tax=Pseudoduganella sp. UC29_106 TaxID=3374553 RepID=UPI003756C8A6
MRRRTWDGAERGVALLVTLLMLVAVLLLGASASTMALLGEQAARAERDRLIAFQAAEDALMDAERDIESGRSPADPPATPPAQPAPQARSPAWQLVDLASDATTPFGVLSGAVMETGEGFEPFRRPRYLAERLPRPGGGFFYRVTVIGFGSRSDTEVVLQSTYRRAADAPPGASGPSGRLSWREIANWRELHAAARAGREEKP